jgi:hypothetical protein
MAVLGYSAFIYCNTGSKEGDVVKIAKDDSNP